MKKVYITLAVIGILILVIDSETAAAIGLLVILLLGAFTPLPLVVSSVAAFITSNISYVTNSESKKKVCDVLSVVFMFFGGTLGVFIYSAFFGSYDNENVRRFRNVLGEIQLMIAIYFVLTYIGVVDLHFLLPG